MYLFKKQKKSGDPKHKKKYNIQRIKKASTEGNKIGILEVH